MQTVVVTGGAGFIGSHLCEALVARSLRVVALDSLVSGRLSNLDAVMPAKNFEFRRVDLAQDEDLGAHFRGVDQVFHLAALADIVPSIEVPLDYVRANVQATMAVLEACRHSKVRRLVYAASSSCYGIPDKTPTKEDAPCRPAYPYALTKLLGEQAVLHWSQVYGLSALSLRLFNVYGPRARSSGSYGAVFGVFLAQKLANKPLTIVGDGRQTRDFTYVSDVVDAMIAAAGSEIKGQALNVGTGRPVSVNRIAELIGGPTVYIPKRPGEPDVTHADLSKIQSLLGWSPNVNIEAGVARMMKELSTWESAPVWTPESISRATRSWFTHLGEPR